MFSAFNPSKCAHTHLEQWAADIAAPGEQSWTSCQSRDSNSYHSSKLITIVKHIAEYGALKLHLNYWENVRI